MPELKSVVCYKWRPQHADHRFVFGPDTVNTLKSMIRRHYTRPVRFICATDDPAGLDPDVEVVPLWDDHASLMSPHGKRNPSCYRRLKGFSSEMAAVFGERFAAIDLDCVVTGDLRQILDRPEDFVAYGDTNHQPHSYYNGSFMLMTAGCRKQVWETFDPVRSTQEAYRSGCYGSDQAVISHCLGPNEAKLRKSDGVYSFRNDFVLRNMRALPENARLVIFHGRLKPWMAEVKDQYPWVRRHWTTEAICPAA